MDPLLPHPRMRPVAAALSRTAGDWRLNSLPKTRTVFLALALSAGAHAVFLLAFNQPVARIETVITAIELTPTTWTPVDDPEPPPTTSEVKELDVPVVNVPKLPDMPTRVDVTTEFVTPLEPPAPATELNPEKITRIPTNTTTHTLPPNEIFKISDLKHPPQVIAQPAPRFPHEMQDRAPEAEVVVDFIVDTTGTVRNATIVSSTNAGFDRAALDGVRQWKFRPGMKDGRKVNTRIRQPIRFALEGYEGR